jgi:hypothetical protein
VSRGLLIGVRLKIGNRRGRDTAHEVQALLSVWWHMSHSGEWVQTLDNRPLPWQMSTRAALIERSAIFLQACRDKSSSSASAVRQMSQELSSGRSAPWSSCRVPLSLGCPRDRTFAFFVAPPFNGSSNHDVADHLVYRVRILLTARDVDAVAYDAVLKVSAETSGDTSNSGHVSFSADWEGFARIDRADAPFSL